MLLALVQVYRDVITIVADSRQPGVNLLGPGAQAADFRRQVPKFPLGLAQTNLGFIPRGLGLLGSLLKLILACTHRLKRSFCLHQLVRQVADFLLALNDTDLAGVGIGHQHPVPRDPDAVPGHHAFTGGERRPSG